MKKIILFGSVILTTSCSLLMPLSVENALTPDRVLKYSTVDELIAKSPNFNTTYTTHDEMAKAKNVPIEEVRIPARSLEMYCVKKENGIFEKPSQPSYFEDSKKYKADYRQELGVYTCSKNGQTLWATEIKFKRDYVSDLGAYSSVDFGFNKIDGRKYDIDHAKDQERLKKERVQYKAMVEANFQKSKNEEAVYKAWLAAQKPITENDIGSRVCKEDFVNIYRDSHKLKSMLHTRKHVIVGNLEQFPKNSPNMKVSIVGVVYYDDSIYPANGATTVDGITLNTGNMVWGKKKDWFLCN